MLPRLVNADAHRQVSNESNDDEGGGRRTVGEFVERSCQRGGLMLASMHGRGPTLAAPVEHHTTHLIIMD